MKMSKFHSAVKEYNRVGVASGIEEADPHRLIQMLMNGALEKIAIAKGNMERGNISEKGGNISWAISIIGGLRASLNMDAGGEIAHNLDDLYEYMSRILAQANIENNPDLLDEATALMRSIKEAWDRIPASLQDSGVPQG